VPFRRFQGLDREGGLLEDSLHVVDRFYDVIAKAFGGFPIFGRIKKGAQ
jgi:hypothetical protein